MQRSAPPARLHDWRNNLACPRGVVLHRWQWCQSQRRNCPPAAARHTSCLLFTAFVRSHSATLLQ